MEPYQGLCAGLREGILMTIFMMATLLIEEAISL